MEKETAVCRGCGLELRGNPYYMGGSACHPETGKNCPSNQYGGFVCSESCDNRVSVEMHSSMPGCGGARKPDTFAQKKINDNWN